MEMHEYNESAGRKRQFTTSHSSSHLIIALKLCGSQRNDPEDRSKLEGG